MRKHIVAGNWKMNTTVAEGVDLDKAIAAFTKVGKELGVIK